MSRNLQFQVLRGTYGQFRSLVAGVDPDTQLSVNPLQLGEMYFTTDTNNLYFGTPGVGVGYIQIGDTSQVNETMQACLTELTSIRLALTCLACEGGKYKPTDFDPEQVIAQQEFATQSE